MASTVLKLSVAQGKISTKPVEKSVDGRLVSGPSARPRRQFFILVTN